LIETQLVSDATDHWQSRSADTLNVPDPPVELNDGVELLTLTWHFVPVGAVLEI
jgi:hypothetical protein